MARAGKIFCKLAVKRRGYSGAALARFLGVTTLLVNRYASSDGLPNLDHLLKVAFEPFFLIVRDVPHLSEPLQYLPRRAVEIDVPGVPGLGVPGLQYEEPFFMFTLSQGRLNISPALMPVWQPTATMSAA